MRPVGTLLRAPAFWHEGRRSLLSDSLLPFAAAFDAISRLRALAAPRALRAPSPVLCVGSVLAGGTGKTPVALAVAERLARTQPELRVHFLSRGYGGSSHGPLPVKLSEHDASSVGDEPLLLAARAPTWVGARRCDTATAACAAGAQLLIMDDGLQHLTLHRDLSLLCIDAADQLGNGRLLPAGPMREPLPRALARVDAVVAVTSAGAEHAPSASALRTALELPRSMPLLRAIIEPTPQSAATLRDARLVAFSATAHPRRFFASLRALGCSFATPPLALPDHAPIAPATLQALRRDADAHGARLATTRKDHVRMAPEQRGGVEVLDVTVRWLDGADVALDALVRPLLAKVLARAG